MGSLRKAGTKVGVGVRTTAMRWSGWTVIRMRMSYRVGGAWLADTLSGV